MRGYQFVCHWLNGDGTEVFTHPDLPLSKVELTSELGVGRLTGTLPPEVIHETTHDGYPVVREWGSAIYVYLDGRLIDAFLVASLVDEGDVVKVDCVGWLGYLSGMPTTKTRYLSYAPGILACSGLVQDVMREPGANIGLRVRELKRMPPVGIPDPESIKEAPAPYKFVSKGAWWTKARIRGGKDVRTRFDIINAGSVRFKGGSGYNKDDVVSVAEYELSGLKGRLITDPDDVKRAYPVPKKPVRPVYPKESEMRKRPKAPKMPKKGKMSDGQWKAAKKAYEARRKAYDRARKSVDSEREQIRAKYQRASSLYSKLDEMWRKIDDDHKREAREFKSSLDEIKRVMDDRKKTHDNARWRSVWWENHDTFSALERIVKDAGFAMRVRHTHRDDGGTGVVRVDHVLELHPLPFSRNRQAELVEGENVLERTKIGSAHDDQVTAVMALGSGEGAKMVRSIWSYPAGGKRGLRKVGTVIDKTLRSRATASERAQKVLSARRNVHDYSDVTVVDHELARAGTFRAGDEVLYRTLDRRGIEVEEWVTILSVVHKVTDGTMVLRVKSMGEDYQSVPDYREVIRRIRAVERKNPSKWNKQRPVNAVEREFGKVS